jgi:hypothetical protein
MTEILNRQNVPQGSVPAPAATPAPKVMTSANASPGTPVQDAPVEIDMESLIGHPLVDADFTKYVKPKNPLMCLHWANRVAAQGGRISQLGAVGFRIAKKEDVIGQDGKAVPSHMFKDGHYIVGDLICMIGSKAAVETRKKMNAQNAVQRVSRAGMIKRANTHINEAVGEVGAKAENRSKIGAFVPGLSDFGQ